MSHDDRRQSEKPRETIPDYSSEPETSLVSKAAQFHGAAEEETRIDDERRALPTSRIAARRQQLAHVRQRLHTRQVTNTTGRNGWDGLTYQATLDQVMDQRERVSLQTRLARARAIDKCIRFMREQRVLMGEVLREWLRLTAPEIEHWNETTDRLTIELSNVSRMLQWDS
jgi:hypothetical protein